MKIKIDSLAKLSKIFLTKSKLYAVGGCVRNFLLNFEVNDIDICSALKPNQVQKLLQNYDYKIQIINENLGTILISDGIYSFEHTTFRTESYKNKGEHTPDKTSFTTEILKDCSRRDFTINALYYDIAQDEILDFCGGKPDLKRRRLRCVQHPKIVFYDDGLRLLRLVRFAGELQFKIHKQTYKGAKKNADNLLMLSKERITAELIKILNSKMRYITKIKNISPYRECRLLYKLGFLDRMFGENFKKISFKFIKKYDGNADLLSLFALDLYYGLVGISAEHFLQTVFFNNLTLSKKQCKDIEAFVLAVVNAKNFDDEYLLRNFNLIEKIAPYLDRKTKKRLLYVYHMRKNKNAPLDLKSLQLTSTDVLSLNAPSNLTGKMLKDALLYAFCYPEYNTKEKLLNYLKKVHRL